MADFCSPLCMSPPSPHLHTSKILTLHMTAPNSSPPRSPHPKEPPQRSPALLSHKASSWQAAPHRALTSPHPPKETLGVVAGEVQRVSRKPRVSRGPESAFVP